MTKRADKAKENGRIKLDTPRRNWKRFDSVVQHRFKGRTAKIPTKLQRKRVYHAPPRSANLTENEIFHNDRDSDAVQWIESMIKRGRSMLSSLTEQERAFQLEIQEEKRRNSVHERLVENILARGDEDSAKNGYGTDTSFKNLNNTLYNSFVDSEDINLDYSKDEELYNINQMSGESPVASTTPVEQSELRSKLLDHVLGKDPEEDKASSESNFLGDSLIQNADDMVEVLTTSSRESRLDEANAEGENYSSEEIWEEQISNEGEVSNRSSDYGEEEDGTRSFPDLEMETDGNLHRSKAQLDDEGVIVNNQIIKNSFSGDVRMDNEQYVEVLSSEEDSGGDDYSNNVNQITAASGFLLDAEQDDESDLANSSDEALDGKSHDSNEMENYSPSPSDRSQSASVSSSEHLEGSHESHVISCAEAEEFAPPDDLNGLGNEGADQLVKSSVLHEKHDAHTDSNHQNLPDTLDFKAIAQEARMLHGTESTKNSNAETINFDTEKVDDQNEQAIDQFKVQHEEQSKISPGSEISEDTNYDQQYTETGNSHIQLDVHDPSPSIVEVKIDEKISEWPDEDEIDNTENDRSAIDETTIYHSFNVEQEDLSMAQSPSSAVDQKTTKYQIVFAESAYSTTSYEDNSNIFEPAANYVSPLTENPFSIKQDENAQLLLEKTLASISEAKENEKSDDSSKHIESGEGGYSVSHSPENTLPLEQDDGSDQETLKHQPGFPSDVDHPCRLSEDEVSDYVTAVFDLPENGQSDFHSEHEVSTVIVEEIESNTMMLSLPVIETEPLIEIAESVTTDRFPPVFDEEATKITNVATEPIATELFVELDTREDGVLDVIQTRPMIETPSVERNVFEELEDKEFSAVEYRSGHAISRQTKDEFLDQTEHSSPDSPSLESKSSADNEKVSQVLFSAPSETKIDKGSNDVVPELERPDLSHPEPHSQSLPIKLLSSPLRAISSLVSGIKEVGSAASDFVKTLDVLDRTDFDEIPERKNVTVDEDTFTSVIEDNGTGAPEASHRRATQDVTEAVKTLSSETDSRFSSVDNLGNDSFEEKAIGGFNSMKGTKDSQVKNFELGDESFAAEDPTIVSVQEKGHLHGPSTVTEKSLNICTDQGNHINRFNDTSSHNVSECVSYSPAKARETVLHIHNLQQLADDVDRMATTQPDQVEDGDSQTEGSAPENPVNLEVDHEVEISLERPSNGQYSVASSFAPGHSTYPAESTMIGNTIISKMSPNEQAQSGKFGGQVTDQALPPLCSTHDDDEIRMPSYLPSDPPSESQQESSIKLSGLVRGTGNPMDSRDQAQRPSSPISENHKDSNDYCDLESNSNEDVKSIPVASSNSPSDESVPVMIGRSQSPSTQKMEKPRSLTDESANTASNPERTKSSSVQKLVKASQRKRTGDDLSSGGSQRKKSKRQAKGKRKVKKRGSDLRKKRGSDLRKKR